MQILGYSAYWDSKQTKYLSEAYKRKSEIVAKAQQGKNFGHGLDTLLVFYNFETTIDEFNGTELLQKKVTLYRFNSKEKSIRVNFFVGYNELTNKSYQAQISFYYNTTIHAIVLVKEKFERSNYLNVKIDFDKLQEEIKQEFLSNFAWLK